MNLFRQLAAGRGVIDASCLCLY